MEIEEIKKNRRRNEERNIVVDLAIEVRDKR